MADRKIKHKGTTNKPAPQGHDYEINILTLSYLDAMVKLRKHRNNFHSYIATEVLDTSPFEDVVYVQVQDGEATSCYVQAKHSLQKFPIKLEELLSDSTKRDKISLLKYFESVRTIKETLNKPNSYYSEIKQRTNFNKESHKFIIFTNRPLHTDVKGVEDTTDDILFYTNVNREGKLYKIIIDDDPESIYQKMKALLMAKVKDVTEKEINEFFNDLIFATDQPNVNKLKQLVEEKLREVTNLPETKWIANTLDKELSQWAHQKDGWFLDKNSELFKYVDQHLASWRQTVCTLNHIDNIREHGINFRDDIHVVKEVSCFLDKFGTDEPQVCTVCYEHLKLTEIKIIQAITDKIKYETVFLHLEDSNSSLKLLNVLKAFESGGSNVLIITVNSTYEMDEILNIISTFFDILGRHANKKIALIVPSHFSTNSLIEKTTEKLQVFNDSDNSFCHLNKESQENILDRTVIFENHTIKLRLLVDDNLQENINGQLLADFIRGDVLIKTTHAVDKFELKNVQNYYIPRQLKRICIKNEIQKKEHDFLICTKAEDVSERNVINGDILFITKNKDAPDFDRIARLYDSNNIHWLIKQNNTLYWHKSQGSVDNLRKYLDIDIDLKNVLSLFSNKTPKTDTNTYDESDDKGSISPTSFSSSSSLNDGQVLLDFFSSDDSITSLVQSNRIDSIQDIENKIVVPISPIFFSSSSSLNDGQVLSDLFSSDDSITSLVQSNRIDSIQDIENKIVVISAEPGMGKSTLLSHFCKGLKSCGEYKEQTILVAKTNLESHSTQFRKLNKTTVTIEDAIYFLIASLNFEVDLFKTKNIGLGQDEGKENNKFLSVEKGKLMLCPHKDIMGRKALCLKIFAHFYNENKIIVLLDGFDETAPEYSNQVLGLLKVLSLTNIRKMVITTRPCGVARELERRLNTFSYSLACFSNKDQLSFLNKFWKNSLYLNDDIEENKLVYFRNKCEEMFFKNYNTSSISNHTVFVSTPHHIEMVATVYMKYFQRFLETGECEDMSKDLNLYSLYDKFFQEKFNILHDVSDSDKCKDMIKHRLLRRITKKEHGQLAIIELFEEKKVENIIADDKKFELIEAVKTAKEKTGIVYLDSNGEPRFVHRTFAEFFAADLLADLLLLKDTKNHKQYESAQHLVYELFTETEPLSKVIISVLNYKLLSECLNNECNNACNICMYRDYFHAALHEDWMKIVEIKTIGNIRDPLDRTPLHLGFYSATNINSITTLLKNQYESEFYIKDNVFNWTAIHYFAVNKNLSGFKGTMHLPLCTEVIDNPELLQDIYGKTPLMHALERICEAIDIFANELKVAQYLKDHNGNTSLHYFTDALSQSKREKNTTYEDILKRSRRLGIESSEKNIFMFKSNDIYHKLIIKFLVAGSNFFEPNMRGVMPYMQMLSDKETCKILYIIMMNKPELTQFVSETEWKNKWDHNLTQSARLQDNEGKTILHHAVVADKLYEFGLTESFLRYQAIVDGINIQDHEGKTALHHALYYDDKSLTGCIPEIPCLMKYGADVTIMDNIGNSPIQMIFNKICAIEFNRDEEFEIFRYLPLDYVIALCRRQCKSEDHHWKMIKVRFFINFTDKYGRTATHYVVSSGNIEKMCSILKYKPNLDIEDKEGKIPVDAIFDNVDLLEMLDCQLSLRDQLCNLLLSMPKTKINLDKFVSILGRYKNIAYYLIENNAINVNRAYGGKTLYNILNNKQ